MERIQSTFEKWAKDHKFLLNKDEKVVYKGKQIYANPMTQGAWMSWCGAIAWTSGVCQAGVSTEEMAISGICSDCGGAAKSWAQKDIQAVKDDLGMGDADDFCDCCDTCLTKHVPNTPNAKLTGSGTESG